MCTFAGLLYILCNVRLIGYNFISVVCSDYVRIHCLCTEGRWSKSNPLVSCYRAPQYSMELILGLGTVVGKQTTTNKFCLPTTVPSPRINSIEECLKVK